MSSKLLLLAILVCLSCNVSALRCYVCDGCNDPFTPTETLIGTCSDVLPIVGETFGKLNNRLLSKANTKAIGSACLKVKNDAGIVLRDCVPSVNGLDVCTVLESVNPDVSFDCEVCEEDLCNSNVMYRGNIILNVTLCLAMFLFYRM